MASWEGPAPLPAGAESSAGVVSGGGAVSWAGAFADAVSGGGASWDGASGCALAGLRRAIAAPTRVARFGPVMPPAEVARPPRAPRAAAAVRARAGRRCPWPRWAAFLTLLACGRSPRRWRAWPHGWRTVVTIVPGWPSRGPLILVFAVAPRTGPIVSGPPAEILPDRGAAYMTYAQIMPVPRIRQGEDDRMGSPSRLSRR